MFLFDQSTDFLEVVRHSFMTYLIIALPVLVTLSPPCLAAKEFPAFRLQQFDLHGTHYGSSGSLLNVETRILPGSTVVSSPRRCYVIKLVDLTVSLYRKLLKTSVAGVVIIVPEDFKSFSDEFIEEIKDLEMVMLREATHVPVYFIKENEEVMEMYETVKISAESLSASSSAAETLLQHIHGNGIQLISSLGTPKSMTDAQIVSIQGALVGSKATKNFPIIVSAPYDSLSPAAELSFGGDSNGSGTVALVELARLFSHLYNSRGTTSVGKASGRPQGSLMFLLSGGGHFNYQGTQKYLEDQLDSSDHSDLQETRLAICLHSLSAKPNRLYIHVSRSIREGSMLHTFIQNLIETSRHNTDLKIELVQRKIRTESLMSWEHEKFHLKKINAVTLSSHESPNFLTSSMLDTKDNVDLKDLVKKTHAIGEALAATLYNVSSVGTAFSGTHGISDESVTSLMDFVTSQPRSAQLLASKQNKFVLALRSLLSRYTHETSLFYMKPDVRDSNFVFFDSTAGVITAYNVKPAVFDLVLSIVIVAYLIVVYLAMKYFDKIYEKLKVQVTSSRTNGTTSHRKAKAN